MYGIATEVVSRNKDKQNFQEKECAPSNFFVTLYYM